MIATETAQAVSLSRRFRGSREDIFDVWTSPVEMMEWWCPPGFSDLKIEQELREGGRYRYSMRRDSDGEGFAHFGEFVEIRRPELLVFTWSWDAPNMDVADTRVTVKFETAGADTILTLIHEKLPDGATRNGHQLGWLGMMDRLSGRRGGAGTGEMAALAAEVREARRVALKELAGLNEGQWSFKESGDRWSIAEITEHLADAAGRGLMTLQGMLGGPPSSGDLSGNDGGLRIFLRDRSRKFPASMPPTGKQTMPEARARFVEAIEGLAGFVESNTANFRKYAAEGPAGAPWDGVQWIVASAGHTLRHVDQMREVKAASGYPA